MSLSKNPGNPLTGQDLVRFFDRYLTRSEQNVVVSQVCGGNADDVNVRLALSRIIDQGRVPVPVAALVLEELADTLRLVLPDERSAVVLALAQLLAETAEARDDLVAARDAAVDMVNDLPDLVRGGVEEAVSPLLGAIDLLVRLVESARVPFVVTASVLSIPQSLDELVGELDVLADRINEADKLLKIVEAPSAQTTPPG